MYIKIYSGKVANANKTLKKSIRLKQGDGSLFDNPLFPLAR